MSMACLVWLLAFSYTSDSMVRLRSSALSRFVVIVMLLWAATDLAFPQLCAADSRVATLAQARSGGDASPQPDDCFCCCHHVVPVSISVSAVLVGVMDLSDAQPAGFPLGIVRAVFHPPLNL